MAKEIYFFIREEPYGFLSNFWRCPVYIETKWGTYRYPTNEHFYQSQKANCEKVHDWIVNAPHARLAMVIGRQIEHNPHLKDKFMRPNWDEYKDAVMLRGLQAKFKNDDLRMKLLETGDVILHEDNPKDPYWGIGDGTGKSMLGKLLMQVRDEIRIQLLRSF